MDHVLCRNLDRCDEAQDSILEHERHDGRRGTQSDEQLGRVLAQQDCDADNACDDVDHQFGRLDDPFDRFLLGDRFRVIDVVQRIEERSAGQCTHNGDEDARGYFDTGDDRRVVTCEDDSGRKEQ